MGWGSYQPHQKHSQRCSRWTYRRCKTAHRLCGSNEGCGLPHSRPLRSVKSKLQLPPPVDISLFYLLTYIPTYKQETARLESENYVQQQKIAVAAELKSVLDSWVRYEQQVKEREQADLTKSVIDKVIASLKDDRVQKDILVNAVAEIEREQYLSFFFSPSCMHAYHTMPFCLALLVWASAIEFSFQS